MGKLGAIAAAAVAAIIATEADAGEATGLTIEFITSALTGAAA